MEFQFEPTAYEQLRLKTPKKPTKAQLKAKLRKLCAVCNGWTSAMKYTKLTIAKKFATDNGLDFPQDSQKELSLCAKRLVGLPDNWSLETYRARTEELKNMI